MESRVGQLLCVTSKEFIQSFRHPCSHRYLLQNWWRYVEMYAEYLKASGATLYYVETKQTNIPESKNYAECEAVDKPDS